MNHILDRTILLGSRPSQLARWQTNHVAELLQNAAPGLKAQTVLITTEGDRVLDKPLPEIGGKGVFTAELESRLYSREIDLVVHSLKDLPVEPSEGLTVAAIPQRADAHDVLISPGAWTLATLPRGARVGTSSLRRSAQLLAARPDLQLLPLRGNVDTRVRKVMGGEYDAIVLAAAGVTRLGLDTDGMQILPFDAMLPAPGQGALAVQCRNQDTGLLALLRLIDHTPTRAAVTAERAFLAGLGGGCSAPVAAYGTWDNEMIVLNGLVASVDGQHVLRLETTGTDSGEVGETLASQALDQGAGEWLK